MRWVVLLLLLACTKQIEEPCIEVTMVTYVNGKEIKRVTSPWYSNQDLAQTDTIYCPLGEVIVTTFRECEQ